MSWDWGDLHYDEDRNEDGDKSSPGDPCNLLELTNTRTNTNHNRGDDGEVVRAERVIGQCIQCSGNTHHSRSSDNNKSNQEEDAGNLLDDPAANQLAHVSDTVASRVVVSKLALDECTPGVQALPSQNVNSTWECAERVHSRRDGEDTSGEDDYNGLNTSAYKVLRRIAMTYVSRR